MVHRIRQGVRALFAWALPLDSQQAEAVLSPALMELFERMRRSERQHSLRVLATLREWGFNRADLLVAGLLHDVGKSRAPIGLVGRTLIVLVKAFAPTLYARLSDGEARGWRRAFVVAERHPAWGADMLAQAGAPPLAVRLVHRHQEKLKAGNPRSEEDRLLAALQTADSIN